MEWVTKMKLDVNSIDIHPQFNHTNHLMDGVFVD
jgi:hypothetical protein